MAEGEHTIISRIPRERLAQIAGRKLMALGIPVRLSQDRETLEGELPFSTPLAHPATGQAIARARFGVQGHDHLRFLEAPLSALPAVPFFDCERASALEQRVAEALTRRLVQLQAQAAELKALGLDPVADPERLAARAVVKTPTHAFEILGEADGIRVARIAPVGGKPCEVPESFPRLALEEHGSLADLEVWLASRVPEMEGAGAPQGAPPAPGPARLEAMPPPRTALTLGQIVQAFGEAGVLAPSAPVEVFQEFQSGGTRYRFVAVREVGTTFRGRVIGPEGDVWSERFDLADFPGPARAVALALGVAPEGEGRLPAEAPEGVAPQSGEVWVMCVVLEQESDDEVRYVGTDVDGHPYGAARVLKRSDFEAVFSRGASGWRLPVIIDQVQGDQVLYRQLDPQRQPVGAPRKMATAVLAANFVPESAAP